MISYVKTHTEYFDNVAKVPLLMNMQSLDEWVDFMTHQGIRADEIALLALGIVYHRHILVVTNNRPWCTVNVNCIKQDFDLYDHCSTHLLYMGHNMFGELKRKINPLPALYMVADFPLSQRANNLKSNLEVFSDIVNQYGKQNAMQTNEDRQPEYVPKYGGSDYEDLNTFFDNNVEPSIDEEKDSSPTTSSSNDLPENVDDPTVNTVPTLDSDSEESEINDGNTSGDNNGNVAINTELTATPGSNEPPENRKHDISGDNMQPNSPFGELPILAATTRTMLSLLSATRHQTLIETLLKASIS